jgi:hypothetical protein
LIIEYLFANTLLLQVSRDTYALLPDDEHYWWAAACPADPCLFIWATPAYPVIIYIYIYLLDCIYI